LGAGLEDFKSVLLENCATGGFFGCHTAKAKSLSAEARQKKGEGNA